MNFSSLCTIQFLICMDRDKDAPIRKYKPEALAMCKTYVAMIHAVVFVNFNMLIFFICMCPLAQL